MMDEAGIRASVRPVFVLKVAKCWRKLSRSFTSKTTILVNENHALPKNNNEFSLRLNFIAQKDGVSCSIYYYLLRVVGGSLRR